MVTPETYAQHVQAMHPPKPEEPPSPYVTGAPSSTPVTPQATGYTPGANGIAGNIIPIGGPILAKDYETTYLKGTDIPEGQSTVSFKLIQFVRDPQGRSKLAAQISETFGKRLFGFNATNIRAIAALGVSDLQTLAGKTIHCVIGLQPNPQKQGMPTKAIFVQRVE